MEAHRWKCKNCRFVVRYGVKQDAPTHCRKCGGSTFYENDSIESQHLEHRERTRPRISQMVINEFTALVDAQDSKGIEKYGRTIDDAIDEDYDWRVMALEECADQLKYLVRDVKRLEKQLRNEKAQRIYLEKMHLKKEESK